MSAADNDSSRIQWTTRVSSVEPDLLYRGYRTEELAHSQTYLETAFLLVTGELPTSEQWADWQALLMDGLTLPDSISAWISRVPEVASPMDVLSGVLTRVRLSEGGTTLTSDQGVQDRLPQWLGFLTAVVAGRVRISQGQQPLAPREDLGFVGNLWWLFQGREPSSFIERAIETLLIIGADHGISPTTAAVRLAAAAGADFPIALQAGVSTATSWYPVGQGMETLDVLREVRTADRVPGWVEDKLSRNQTIAGFEHRIYRVGDPRSDWVAPLCRQAAEQTGRLDREELASAIEGVVWDRLQRLPAVNWHAARLLDYLGCDRQIFGPLFVIARLAGWAAHYLEQRSLGTLPATTTIYQGLPPRSIQRETE